MWKICFDVDRAKLFNEDLDQLETNRSIVCWPSESGYSDIVYFIKWIL